METNEQVKQVLRQEVENVLSQLLEEIQTVQEGNLEQVEQAVLQASLAVGRRWLSRLLTQSSSAGPARRTGRCGHPQRLVARRPKHLLTLVGEVEIRRPYYQCLKEEREEDLLVACSHGEVPWDERWGVPKRRTSPGVQKLVSYLAATMTLEETVEVFERWVPLSISGRQAPNLLQPIGEALLAQEEHEVQTIAHVACRARSTEEAEPEPSATPLKRLCIEMDGIYARHRRESVHLSAEEQQWEGDVYREIKVGAVFVGEPGPERSQLVPGVFVDRAGSIRYVARRASAEAFGPLVYALAERCGISHAEQVVVIGDGAPWIWNLAEEQVPQAVQIVDLWHAWAKQGCHLLCEGKIAELIQRMEALPRIAPEPGASRSVPEIGADYFRTNAARMRYPIFRAQGMHLGSGIAEAACKTVVSTRAKRSGMRWTSIGLDAILALRTAVLNHEFDQRWSDYTQRTASRLLTAFSYALNSRTKRDSFLQHLLSEPLQGFFCHLIQVLISCEPLCFEDVQLFQAYPAKGGVLALFESRVFQIALDFDQKIEFAPSASWRCLPLEHMDEAYET